MRTRKTNGNGKVIVTLVVAVAIILMVASRLQTPSVEEVPDVSAPPAVFVPGPVTLAPGLHLLGALTPSVAYVVDTGDGLILVDAGLEDSHELLLQQLHYLKLDVQQVKLILLTHGHGDHYLGARAMQQRTNAEIYAGKGDCDVLRQAGPREAVFSTFPMAHVPIHETVVDRELTGGELIEMGNAQIEVVATPGHTPGSVCYLMKRSGQTSLFSGDTIMTISGDLGTYATYLPPRYRGNAADYLKSLRKLAELPAPDFLLPGHPRTDTQTVNAMISQQTWSSLLTSGIQNMQDLTDRFARDGANFLDGNPKQILPGLYYLGDYQEAALYCVKSHETIVLFDAPGDAGFTDELDRRLQAAGLQLSALKAVVLTGLSSQAMGGLPELLNKTNCSIVVAETMQDEAARRFPDRRILTTNDKSKELVDLDLQSIAVEGIAGSDAAYQFRWGDKRILVSGRIPLKVNSEISKEVQRSQFSPSRWLKSLEQLRRIRPDVWLPARPVNGQLANLYDNDWPILLRDHRFALGL